MGYKEPDVYMQPEHFGLMMAGEVSWDDEPYQFDLTIVLRDHEGRLYWASDSGCSCPTPFEDFTSVEHLKTGKFYELAEDLMERLKEETPATVAVTQLLERLSMETMA